MGRRRHKRKRDGDRKGEGPILTIGTRTMRLEAILLNAAIRQVAKTISAQWLEMTAPSLSSSSSTKPTKDSGTSNRFCCFFRKRGLHSRFRILRYLERWFASAKAARKPGGRDAAPNGRHGPSRAFPRMLPYDHPRHFPRGRRHGVAAGNRFSKIASGCRAYSRQSLRCF